MNNPPPYTEGTDAMIAIMGPTGSGKSTFIKSLTEDPEICIGHTLESETEVVKLSRFVYKNKSTITFVDTPGFDDSREGVTDADVLKKIAVFLKEEYEDDRKLTGVIYLHRISDVRMGGVSRANFRLFRKLCGTDTLVNVVIITTFWDKVGKIEGMERMKELEIHPGLFQPVIAAGGKIMSHDEGPTSANSILDAILANQPKPLQIQEEMRQGKDVLETAAGSELDARLTELISKHQKEMEDLQTEMAAIREADEITKAELREECGKLKLKIKRWEEDQKKLEEGLLSVKAEMEAAKAKADANMWKKGITLLMRPNTEKKGSEGLEGNDEQVKKGSTADGDVDCLPLYSSSANGTSVSKPDFTLEYRDRAKDVGGDICSVGGRGIGVIISKPGRVLAQGIKAVEALLPESERRIERDMVGYADRVEEAARQGGHLLAQFCPKPMKGAGRLAGGAVGALAAEGVCTVQGAGRLGKGIVMGIVQGVM